LKQATMSPGRPQASRSGKRELHRQPSRVVSSTTTTRVKNRTDDPEYRYNRKRDISGALHVSVLEAPPVAPARALRTSPRDWSLSPRAGTHSSVRQARGILGGLVGVRGGRLDSRTMVGLGTDPPQR
jgi:hypothetical protein